MTNELRLALALSVGLHTGLLIGLPFTTPAAFDVERAPTSVEIVLVAPRQPAVTASALTTPEPAIPDTPVPDPEQPPDPAPQTVATPELRGTLTEVLPSYLRNPAPVYPTLARKLGYEGTVIVEVEALPSGRCGALAILHSSGYRLLDEAAERAIRAWQFKPALRGKTPVAVWVEIPVTFRLIENTQE